MLLFAGRFGWTSPTDKGGQWNEMAADCIVTPRALSAGKKSVTVEPSSTSVRLVRIRHLEGQTLKCRDMNSGECAVIGRGNTDLRGILRIEMAREKNGILPIRLVCPL